ncbi:MAG: hypothetical protein Q7R73_03085 [bacterium]|nr:hypothetical protein [bacterium]
MSHNKEEDMTTTIFVSLADRLAQAAKADKEARLNATKPEVPASIEAPRVQEEHRPKELGLEILADKIIPEITGSLSGELPESLEKALDLLPQSKAIIEEAFAAVPGLREGVEKRYLGLYKKQEKRLGIIYFKEWIADLLTDRLPYGLAQELVAFGAIVEIPKEENDTIQAQNRAAREHKNTMAGKAEHPKNCSDCRQTFVRQSYHKKDDTTHYYLEMEKWLSDALNDHHRALKRSQETWEKHLKTLNVPDFDKCDFKDALLHIAMGERVVTTAYLPFEKRLKIGPRFIFGKFLVQGIEPDEQGVPQMIFLPLEGGESLDECESPMYFAVRDLADMAVFQFKPLRKKETPWFAFASMQEKSGKSAGLARKILMGALGVEERKHDQPFGGQRVAYSGSTAKSAGPTDMELKLREQGLKPTSEGIDGSGLPGSEGPGAPLGDRSGKPGGRVERLPSESRDASSGKPKPRDRGGAKRIREDEGAEE